VEELALAPAGAFRTLYRTTRFAAGIAFCVLSLGACVLVARRLSDASWPLEGAHVPLVFLAASAYLASFGFRAFGWHRLFPARERPDGARCLAACGAAAASGVVLPFRLDYVVKISILRRLGGVRLGLETIAISIVALGMIDAVAMLPLAISALATSGPVLRAPLIVVVLFCVGCLTILALGQRVTRLPVVGRWERLHAVYRRAADTTRLSRSTFVAGLLLLGCWTSRASGSTLLLSAFGVGFSPTLALVVLCMSGAASILPITAGGAVVGMGTTAGVLFALGVTKGTAINFALASGLLLTSTALAAAALGLGGSLLLTLRRRRPLGAWIPGDNGWTRGGSDRAILAFPIRSGREERGFRANGTVNGWTRRATTATSFPTRPAVTSMPAARDGGQWAAAAVSDMRSERVGAGFRLRSG
jgi:uncharacterized membrane protein YbhN (UPF0104 family)